MDIPGVETGERIGACGWIFTESEKVFFLDLAKKRLATSHHGGTIMPPARRLKSRWVGLLGEKNFSGVYNVPMDLSIRQSRYGDGGSDFTIHDIDIDVKTRENDRPEFMTPKDGYDKGLKAHVYVVARLSRDETRSYLSGWLHRQNVENRHVVEPRKYSRTVVVKPTRDHPFWPMDELLPWIVTVSRSWEE